MNPIKNLFLDERFVFLLISLNAILIFAQGFPNTGYEEPLSIADDIISVMFMVELIIKGTHYGWKEYVRSGWNKFDIFLVLVSIPSLVFRFIGGETVNLSILLVLRVFRVFKFFRFIKFFPQVEHIFRSARQAVGASFMVLAGFFVFIFIASLLCCYFYRDIAPSTFGNPIIAYYSTFQVFTIEGWNAIPAEIDKEALITMPETGGMSSVATFFTRILFITLFIIGGVFGLSIVNSIFVDAMVSNSQEDTEEEVEKIEEEVGKVREDLAALNAKLDRLLAAAEAKNNKE